MLRRISPARLRCVAATVVLALLGGSAGAVRAAEPYDIPTIMSLTGSAAFLGKSEERFFAREQVRPGPVRDAQDAFYAARR